MYSLILAVALTASHGVGAPPSADARRGLEHGLAEIAAGRLEDAEAALAAALEAGPEDAAVLTALATLRQLAGRPQEAETLLRRAVEVAVPRSKEQAESLIGLAGVFLDTGRTSEAERAAARALKVWDELSGRRSADRVPALVLLSEVRIVRSEYEQAESLLREADRLAAFPVPSTFLRAAVASRRGVLYMAMGRYPEAEPLLELSLDLSEETYGPDHPALLQLTYTLATCYQLRNRPADAASLYERFLSVGEKTYGPDHPFLRQALVGLEQTAARLDDRSRAASYRLRLAAFPPTR